MSIKEFNLAYIITFGIYSLFLNLITIPLRADPSDKLKIIKVVKKSIDREVIVKKFDGPYISGNYAMIGTIYIEGAGQSLLKKEKDNWRIVSEGGGAFGEQGMIKYGGFPKRDAESIMKQQEKTFKKK
jgi:hypothetical protein